MNGAPPLLTFVSLLLVSTVVTLGNCRPSLPDDLPGLIKKMAANDMNVHTEAARKVQDLYGVDGLLEALTSHRARARRQAARFLRLNPEMKARGALIAASYDEDPHARGWAVFALSIFSDPDVIARLVELQRDDESVVRYFATESLAIIADRLEGPDNIGAEKRLEPIEQLVETTFDSLRIGQQPDLPCALHVVPAGPRLSTRSPRGVELYTWRTESGGLLFSLLWGTKREKSPTEITSSECALSTLSEVVSVFRYLAREEHIVWVRALNSKSDLAYPLHTEALRAQAKHAGVTLVDGPDAPE